jgi:hypothetical protein
MQERDCCDGIESKKALRSQVRNKLDNSNNNRDAVGLWTHPNASLSMESWEIFFPSFTSDFEYWSSMAHLASREVHAMRRGAKGG